MEYQHDQDGEMEPEEQYWQEVNTTWLENFEGSLVDAINKIHSNRIPSTDGLIASEDDWLDTKLFISKIKISLDK